MVTEIAVVREPRNVFRLSIPGLVGNFANEVLPANSIETGQFLSLAQSAP
jgi:hypothetical protein